MHTKKYRAGTSKPSFIVDCNSIDCQVDESRDPIPLAERILENQQGRSEVMAEVMSSLYEVVVMWIGGNQFLS